MKKILGIILFLITLNFIFSDDGSWNILYSELKGNLYNETENKDITLEKEILKFSGLTLPSVEAIFQFRNVTDKELTVEAGFPIEFKIPVKYNITQHNNYYTFPLNKYGHNNHIEIASSLFDRELKIRKNDEEFGFTEESLEYFTEEYIIPRRKIVAKDFKNIFKFSISQNDKPIQFDYVIIDMKVEEDNLIATVHYHHNLTFKPNETSIVKVSYYDDCIKGIVNAGISMKEQYEWNYILGTGGTWKDSIKKLYFVLPNNLKPFLPKQFKCIGDDITTSIYLAENYKPKKEDVINISDSYLLNSEYYYNNLWFDEPKYLEIPKNSVGGIVIYKNCSSFLKEKTTIYTEKGVIQNIDYSGLRLFDGIRESAWCEGKKDDGIGEWVEFELLKDINAVEIQNGFNKAYTEIQGKDLHTFYKKNNRVKTLEFVSNDGKIKEILNLFDSENIETYTLELPKGIYKVYIRDIYKGTKWSDTCLGEIKFYEKNVEIEKLKTGDDFFKKYY